MSRIIIERRSFEDLDVLKKELYTFLDRNVQITKTPIFVFDIRGVIEFGDHQIDHQIVSVIRKLLEHNFTVMTLMYDSNDDRMKLLEQYLNRKTPIFKEVHKIFIKRKDKGLIMHFLDEYVKKNLPVDLSYNQNKQYRVALIDDHRRNLYSTLKYSKSPMILFLYKAHREKKRSNNINDLNYMVDRLILNKAIGN